MGNHGLSVFPHHSDAFGEYIIANEIGTRPGPMTRGDRKTRTASETGRQRLRGRATLSAKGVCRSRLRPTCGTHLQFCDFHFLKFSPPTLASSWEAAECIDDDIDIDP